jgi:hypothetical protein
MISSVKSRQRIIDHGEVFTPPKLVNDMLDLVAHECQRIDSRFLEPACGDGNFLAEVLRRRLAVVDHRAKCAIVRWEKDALLGLACLYGIELLCDNVNECRDRLHAIFTDAYTTRFGSQARPAVLHAARHIVRTNIHQGDALAMTTVGDKAFPARPLIFTEWSLLPNGQFKRHLYEYRELPPDSQKERPALFAAASQPIVNDHDGQPVFIANPLKALPLVHYLKLGLTGTPHD